MDEGEATTGLVERVTVTDGVALLGVKLLDDRTELDAVWVGWPGVWLPPPDVGAEVVLHFLGRDRAQVVAAALPHGSGQAYPDGHDSDDIGLYRGRIKLADGPGAATKAGVTEDLLGPLGGLGDAVVKIGVAVNSLLPGSVTPDELLDIARLVAQVEAGGFRTGAARFDGSGVPDVEEPTLPDPPDPPE